MSAPAPAAAVPGGAAAAPSRRRRALRIAVTLAVVAWIAGLHVALAWIERHPEPRRMFGDEYTYLRWAVELSEGGPWRPDPPLWPPLYPHLLAPLIDAGGRGAVALAQGALLLAAALALRAVGRALTGPGPAADLAAAAVLGFPPLAAYVHYLWPEVLHLALLLFAVWILVAGRRGAGWLIALGLALGLAVGTKHLLGPVLPLLLAPVVLEGGRRGLLRGLGRTALAAAACAAVLVPLAAADAARHGEPPARAAALFNLWVGLEERARPEAAGWLADAAYRRYRASAPDQRGRREFLEREVARRLGEPGAAARLVRGLGPAYARLLDSDGGFIDQLPGGSTHAGGVGYRDPPGWLAAALRTSSRVLWALVLALAPLGVVLAPPRSGRRWRWLPVALVAYGLGLFVVLHVDARFRLQVVPFLLLWAAVAAVRMPRGRWMVGSPAAATPGGRAAGAAGARGPDDLAGVDRPPPAAALAGALAASALLLVLGFGGLHEVPALPAGVPAADSARAVDVLIVTFDAAGDDSGWGGGLAARGARFTRSFSTAPSSAAAHASMFTGRYPSFHGAGDGDGGRPLAPAAATLAEVLADAGYETAAVVGGTGVGPEIGLAQGFAVYDDAPGGPGEDASARALAAARSLLAGMEEPWLLWLHLPRPDDLPGSWLDDLAAAVRLERTLVIVTAGRGVAAEERGSGPAGRRSIELDRVRVPLLLAGPGVLPGLVVEPPVTTGAVFATVLDAVGVALPADLPRPRPVGSLMPLSDRRRASGPAVFVESAGAVGVARGDAFLVRERAAAGDAGPAGDPAAHRTGGRPIPLTGAHVPIAVERELAALLDAFERRTAAARAAASRPPPSVSRR